MITTTQLLYAFVLTLFAGLSTGVGGLAVLMMKRTNIRILATALGFSAGVMIYVSFVELFPQGMESANNFFGDGNNWIGVLSFFIGIALIAIIDKVIPEEENPHEYKSEEDIELLHEVESAVETNRASLLTARADYADTIGSINNQNLERTGLFSALAIAIHNFPEGLATFMSAIADPALGLSIAVAIAIHNIPEGVSVAVPIYYATGSRKKAFIYALLSGFAEPIGAIVGALVLLPFLNDGVMGIIFSAVSGIMVYISLDELLPTAEKYGEHHMTTYGVLVGMVIMAISLLVL